MIPENLQDRNVRRFKGFTPQQVEKLLAGKGFKPNSREGAEYLGAMAERAEEMLQKVKPVDKAFSTVALWVALTISQENYLMQQLREHQAQTQSHLRYNAILTM